ncbi:MAG: transposase [Cyanobacteriota bacterium]
MPLKGGKTSQSPPFQGGFRGILGFYSPIEASAPSRGYTQGCRIGYVDLCEKWDCKLIEFNGESEYVHILFQYYPKMEISKFINGIESVFSRHICAEFAEVIDAVCRKGILPKIRRHPKIIARQCFALAHTPLISWLRQRSEPPLTLTGRVRDFPACC